jgi:outer membrane protein TolC
MDPSDASFWQVRLDPIEEPSPSGPLPDVEAAVAKALAARYDLARASHDLENARTDVEFFGNQRLPDVRVETSYRGSGLGGTQFLRTGEFPGVITGSRNRSFGDALGQVFTPDYPAWSFGVTINYPIGRSYEEAGLARAEVERRQAAQRLASMQLETAETVRKAERQIRSAAQRMEAAQAGARLARERFEAEQRRFEVGLSTTFLVTQAQRDLLQAEVNQLQTALDHESALVSFEAVQLAPPAAAGDTVALTGASVVLLPPPSPRGIFRASTGGFQ